MAKLATLIDDFQDGVIDGAKWPTTQGTVAETGGRLRLTPVVGASRIKAAIAYDLTNSQVVAHIPTITANGSTGSLQSGMAIEETANVNFIGIRKVGSQLICTKGVGGVETQLSFTPYSAINHLFWRIRADASNIYLETSPNGTGYFIQHTESIATLGFAISNVGFYFTTSYSGVEPFPGTFQIEAVNPGLPIIASGSSTSTGSLQLRVVSPLDLTANALSNSSGSLILTNVAAPALFATFNAYSFTVGSFSFAILGSGEITASALSTSSGTLAFSAITPTPPELPGGTWYFSPPVAYDNPPTLPEPTRPRYINAHAKWKGGQARGRNVLKHGSVYTIVDTLTVDQMAAADIAYQGGHIYEVSVEEAYSLHLAGFNVYHGTDILTTESGDFLTTESGDILTVEYSLGSS